MHIFDNLRSRSDICFLSFNNTEPKGDLIPGYDFYLIEFSGVVDLHWIKQQQKKTTAKFAIISSSHNTPNINNVEFFTYVNWHEHKNVQSPTSDKTHKFSIDAKLLTQANTWIVSKLLEYKNDSIIYCNTSNIDNNSLNEWGFTSNAKLDQLVDDFSNNYSTFNLTNNNFINSVLYFALTDFHYSFMMDDFIPYVYHGPFISDNIISCLASGQAFIPCGQYQILETLSLYGFQFDYDFDLSWDQDQGNLSRFESICNLIDRLSTYTITDLIAATRDSTQHNLDYFYSDTFKDLCDLNNQTAVDKLHKYVN
jgi:hypothetical protein